MGAKQSKRSVDISGKEAESAGEVAAAGAGGEGRVEQLGDADALKPQLNGVAHITEQTEKQKDLDSGTPENEKDATTEKEAKIQEEEKETEHLTNGDSEQKVENGESTPTPEDGKKPKKEKVKKKWSLRSISFSRKDKPKQEKKQKDEEPKTNGEPEKVPEETAEVAPEPAVTETVKEANPESESKEEKTPETPVTEPITNGSTTPVSPKDESPAAEEPSTPSSNIDSPEPPQPETQPEQLPVNGLSLEEPVKEIVETEKPEESKEEPTAVPTEIVPEIPVKKEVCVEQMPLIDSTPPPLPANPPPSSVASFAATTMAPESTDASLANTADNANPPPNSGPLPKDKIDEPSPNENELTVTQTVSNELPPPPVKEECEEVSVSVTPTELANEILYNANALDIKNVSSEVETIKKESESIKESIVSQNEEGNHEVLVNADTEIPSPPSELLEEPLDKDDVPNAVEDLPSPPPICDNVEVENVEKAIITENVNNTQVTIKEVSVLSNHISDLTEEQLAIKTEAITDSKDANLTGTVNETIECNGNIEGDKMSIERDTPELIQPINSEDIKNTETGRTATTPDDSMPPSLSETNESAPAAGVTSNEDSESFPLPPSDLCRSESEPSPPASLPSPVFPEPETPAHTLQESIPVSDKLAELIPEIPDVPELKTETLLEAASDVAVNN